MRQLNLQLYGRTKKSGFSEELSIQEPVTLTPERARIDLRLEAPTGQKFIELRLDPDDKTSIFALHDLIVKASDETELYRWDGTREGLPNLVGMQAWVTQHEILLESDINDPFLLISLPKPEAAVTLQLCLSQSLFARPVEHAPEAVSALSVHQQELADAVRSLQSTLRVAIDDLAAEQEGLQDALIAHHAHARNESATVASKLFLIEEHAKSVDHALQDVAADVGKAAALDRTLTTLITHLETAEVELTSKVRNLRNTILAEIRDDWRSLGRQIEAQGQATAKSIRERDAAYAASRDAEFAPLKAMIRSLAGSQDSMKQIRVELGASHDEEALNKLRQLKADAQQVRAGAFKSFFARWGARTGHQSDG